MTTIIHRSDGSVEIRTGPRPWRDNNPGDLEAGDFSKRHGMIGTEGKGRWAIFRDEKAGFAALDSLLTTPKYQARTIQVTIEAFAPGNENDTPHYIAMVAHQLNLPASTVLRSLNAAQHSELVLAIARVEGYYHPGTVVTVSPLSAPNAVTPVHMSPLK